MNLFTDLTALLAALKASPFNWKAVWKAFLKVANDVDAFISPATPPLFAAGPENEDCKALCAEITCECEKLAATPPVVGDAEAPTVGKLFPGDGSFLKAIISLILALAPLFIAPAPPA